MRAGICYVYLLASAVVTSASLQQYAALLVANLLRPDPPTFDSAFEVNKQRLAPNDCVVETGGPIYVLQVEYTFSLPYEKQIQTDGVK